MKFVLDNPAGHSHDPPLVYVYTTEDEPIELRRALSLTAPFVYGIFVRHRDIAPDWAHAAIAMIDMAAATTREERGKEGDDGVPGVGYKGSIWYVIQEDPKYAIEAGVDLSNLDNP